MAIDYSAFAFPKGQVKALVKQAKVATIATTDKQENAKAKARAQGQCEVRVVLAGTTCRKAVVERCKREGIDPHHLISGSGKRNRGKSILAEWKLWVCRKCHDLITDKILRPTSADADAATIRFWRSR